MSQILQTQDYLDRTGKLLADGFYTDKHNIFFVYFKNDRWKGEVFSELTGSSCEVKIFPNGSDYCPQACSLEKIDDARIDCLTSLLEAKVNFIKQHRNK